MFKDLKPYPGYRPSGQPWAVALPDHWQVRRGKVLFSRLKRPVRESDGVVTCFRDGVVTLRSLRRTSGFTEALQELGYQGVRAGDLVIHAMDAFAGAVGVSDSDGKCSPVYAICRARNGSEPRYYAALVREMARTQWIMALSRGVRERSTDFRFESFASESLPVPPSDEQAAIVKYLAHAHRRIDHAIAAKRKMIVLLEEQKLVGTIDAVTRGLDPTALIKDSGILWLGPIPAHWESWPIGRLARVGNGSTPSRSNQRYWQNGRYPWLTSSVVHQRRVVEAAQFVTGLALAECHLPKVAPGSVLVAITGQGKTRGHAALLDFEATINQHLAYLSPDARIVRGNFLRCILDSAYRELRRISDDSGSTKGALTCADLKAFRIPVPPIYEQDSIEEAVRAQDREAAIAISRLSLGIGLLREFRTRLTADVVTGQVDVRQIASTLPELVPPEFADVSATEDDLGDEAAEYLEDVDA